VVDASGYILPATYLANTKQTQVNIINEMVSLKSAVAGLSALNLNQIDFTTSTIV
jgi:cell division protein YceG involved in septum cleavage